MTSTSSLFLRRVLLLDAIVSGATGLGLVLLAGPLAGLLDLPVDLLRWAGLALLPFAAVVAWLGRRPVPPAGAVRTVLVINLLWAVDSFLIIGLGWVDPNGLGVAFIAMQAVAVALLGGLQYLGLRRGLTPA
ncbi:MAG: hypothetical protein VYB54_03220 [Pseudomonadota bacterium]|nr:hypothetical protein [Pseudomonadota bacterium]